MAVTPVNGSAPSQSQVTLTATDAKAELRQSEPHIFAIFLCCDRNFRKQGAETANDKW